MYSQIHTIPVSADVAIKRGYLAAEFLYPKTEMER